MPTEIDAASRRIDMALSRCGDLRACSLRRGRRRAHRSCVGKRLRRPAEVRCVGQGLVRRPSSPYASPTRISRLRHRPATVPERESGNEGRRFPANARQESGWRAPAPRRDKRSSRERYAGPRFGEQRISPYASPTRISGLRHRSKAGTPETGLRAPGRGSGHAGSRHTLPPRALAGCGTARRPFLSVNRSANGAVSRLMLARRAVGELRLRVVTNAPHTSAMPGNLPRDARPDEMRDRTRCATGRDARPDAARDDRGRRK